MTRDCPECSGRDEITYGHALDPSARVFWCDRCGGTGEVECEDPDAEYEIQTQTQTQQKAA